MNKQSDEFIHHLKENIEGEVRFDKASRAVYATDASNYRQIPIGVVLPKNQHDVLQAVRVCHEFQVPILSRGGGTSLAGQCCNEAIVIDFTKFMNKVIEIDPDQMTARVQPGAILDDLQDQLRSLGLIFGPDPSTHSRCSLGGMIGNDACGVHSLFAGRTVHNVIELKVLTYDGMVLHLGSNGKMKPSGDGGQREVKRSEQIKNHLASLCDRFGDHFRERFPKIPRCVSGYQLHYLLPENHFDLAKSLVGTEGTCVIVLEATVRLMHEPKHRSLVVAGFRDICEAADSVESILKHQPIGLEAFDRELVGNMRAKGFHENDIKKLPEGNAWLLIEVHGESGETSLQRASSISNGLLEDKKALEAIIVGDQAEAENFWSIREFGPGATVFVPEKEETFSGWEDAAVDPRRLGDYLRDFLRLSKDFGYEGAVYGHFGDGCVHVRLNFDLLSKEGVKKYREFIYQAADLVVRYGGSFSGEHGDGQSRGELLEKLYGVEVMQAFEEFKSIWDPSNKMNPGKLVNAYPMDQFLRRQPGEIPDSPKTVYTYLNDKNDFYRAVSRCVGIGKCRKKNSGIMCPSYMATLEEKHSTRGRARLLAEMMEGDIFSGCWDSEEIKESLELCLSCKACKSECPTNVDVAKYKAEYLHHYYNKHPRPKHAKVFGYLDNWLSVGGIWPWMTNQWIKNSFVQNWIKSSLGIASERELPALAKKNFVSWFKKHASQRRRKTEVILWPDIYNNYFSPRVLQSACKVLECAGFKVRLPKKQISSGRPFYDYGMLDAAKKRLKKIIEMMVTDIRRGVPVVFLEPSSLSVFRDDALDLFPSNSIVRKMAHQSFMLADFLQRFSKVKFENKEFLDRSVILQPHCHESSLFGMDADVSILRKAGYRVEVLDAGCCGMAGAFGMDRDKYSLSMDIAKSRLAPALERFDENGFIVANGFSCREQIAQSTEREAFHTAELLERAL